METTQENKTSPARKDSASCRARTETENRNLLSSFEVRQWPKALTLRLIREIACLLHPPCVAVEWPSRQRFGSTGNQVGQHSKMGHTLSRAASLLASISIRVSSFVSRHPRSHANKLSGIKAHTSRRSIGSTRLQQMDVHTIST